MYHRYPKEMRIPIYNKKFYNYYAEPKPYHQGFHYTIDIFWFLRERGIPVRGGIFGFCPRAEIIFLDDNRDVRFRGLFYSSNSANFLRMIGMEYRSEVSMFSSIGWIFIWFSHFDKKFSIGSISFSYKSFEAMHRVISNFFQSLQISCEFTMFVWSWKTINEDIRKLKWPSKIRRNCKFSSSGDMQWDDSENHNG